MKDSHGFGSNIHGGVPMTGSLVEQLRARLSHVTSLKGAPSGGVAMTSNVHAAAALAQPPKGVAAPVHDAMAGRDAVRQLRGTSIKRDWSGDPIGDLKGKHH